jgi:hypothetical protein
MNLYILQALRCPHNDDRIRKEQKYDTKTKEKPREVDEAEFVKIKTVCDVTAWYKKLEVMNI